MKAYTAVCSVLYKVTYYVAFVAMFATFFVAGLTTIDVVLKLLSNVTPMNAFIPGNYEITQLFLILIVFLVYAVTERDQGHVSVKLVTERLPTVPRAILRIIVCAVELVFVIIICVCSWQQMMVNVRGHVTSSVLFMPYAPFCFCMMLGMLLFAIVLALKLINHIISFVIKDAD